MLICLEQLSGCQSELGARGPPFVRQFLASLGDGQTRSSSLLCGDLTHDQLRVRAGKTSLDCPE
eukprot:5480904-Prymnesium_polylepis.1